MNKQTNHSLLANGKFRISKYFKNRYLSWIILYNTAHLTALVTEFSILQIAALLIITITLLKAIRVSQVYGFLMIDSTDCASVIARRIQTEFSNCVWLINKMNVYTISLILVLVIGLWIVEKYQYESISWWIFGNLLILYLGATRLSKSVMKYQLRLYRDYKKYVIHVIEPNSPEKIDRDEESDSEIEDLSHK